LWGGRTSEVDEIEPGDRVRVPGAADAVQGGEGGWAVGRDREMLRRLTQMRAIKAYSANGAAGRDVGDGGMRRACCLAPLWLRAGGDLCIMMVKTACDRLEAWFMHVLPAEGGRGGER
jgi:hypothetical protein